MAVFRNGKPIDEGEVKKYDTQEQGLARFAAMREWHKENDPKVPLVGDGRFGLKNGVPRKFKHRESFD